jgi:large subunit ribosomal protein L6
VSRIGRMPVVVPAGVEVEIKGSHVRVKGPKGQLERVFPADMKSARKTADLTFTALLTSANTAPCMA